MKEGKLPDVRWARRPWQVDEMGGFIVDADGNRVLDGRGWGHLTGGGGLRLDSDKAADIQTDLLHFVVNVVNKSK